MDGNGRWAQQRQLPRSEGHRKGLRAAQQLVDDVQGLGVRFLTLFAFSNENWQRPADEVSALMGLFSEAISDAKETFQNNQVRLRFIGDVGRFSVSLRAGMASLEKMTAGGDGLTLTLAIGYSGRWDIVQAAAKFAANGDAANEENFEKYLATAELPAPDLLIRTGGEMRISNFMLWQSAYTELYFTDTLWPDFGAADLRAAVADYERRERRYGRVLQAEKAASGE